MTSHSPKTSLEFRGSPLIIGEVLLDHFPDGRSVLGGAPFNVAWNLQGLGRKPTFVSSVGEDAEGKQIRERMAEWGMKLDGLQTSKEHQTGAVQVTLENGQPSYDIIYPRAYDFIQPPEASSETADTMGASSIYDAHSIFYHGTLAWRAPQTRETLKHWISNSTASRFVDINIREPWFDAEWLPELLGGADFIKLNDEELSGISGLPCTSDDEVRTAVEKISEQYGSSAVYFITCGSRGAYAITHDRAFFAEAPEPESMMDTVGAGDGFAAATIDGILAGISYQEVIDRAVRFAARICGLRGATTTDVSVYEIDE
ncbi:PfkB domain-containing protein [Rhodopirellula maiorica SM1]|uniref:PfkB domain-containing protein n=1 Tax=Rhodopirellula maiorica SM1 TaxID=1265738 RepID=M5RAT4_9BACT|nr:PfkB family carbohydrate kinase [Rhodopirellula maiorica]EMI16171.1 PfkB domain-containing protein [Rhodopirellula maiorica SM1]